MATKAQSIEFLLSQVRASGVALAGGEVEFFSAGTSTRKTIWLDRNKATPAANPYTLDANGTAQLYGDGLYRIVIRNSASEEKYDRDYISIKDASGLAYDAADYASLAAACTALNGTGATLQYSTDQTLAANLVTDVELLPLNGAKINHTTYTISYAGSTARWPLAQIFNGTGAISGIKAWYPEWVGAVSTNAAAPINKILGYIPAGGGSIELTASSYPITAVIDFPETSSKIKLFTKTGSAITVAGTHDAIDLTAQSENYGGHILEGLTITGPNNYYGGAMSATTGAGIRMQRAAGDLTNTATAYNTVIRDCVVQGFKYGIRSRSAIKTRIEGRTFIRFNNYGIYYDGGMNNANNINGAIISLNDTAGVYSAGTTGGALTASSSNTFDGCLMESNHPYGATGGIAIYLNNSYDFVFNGTYTEDNEYSVYLTGTSQGNRFNNHRTAPGPAGLDAILFSGALAINNTFTNSKSTVLNLTDVNVISDNASQKGNQFIDCEGFNFIAGSILKMPYVRNMRPNLNIAADKGYGTIIMPPQGYVADAAEGAIPGTITGIGTATATIHCKGLGEIAFDFPVSAAATNTTITTIEGAAPGQILVLWNYQATRTVTIKHAGSTGAIVLKPTLSSVSVSGAVGTPTYTADAVMTTYGQMIVFYIAGNGRAYEIGRNF